MIAMFKQKRARLGSTVDGGGKRLSLPKKHPPSHVVRPHVLHANRMRNGDAGRIRLGVPVGGGRYPMFVISFVIFPYFFFRLVFSTQIPRRRHVPELGISLWRRRLGARGRPEDGPTGATVDLLVSSPGSFSVAIFLYDFWAPLRRVG